jgi:hypothetical protein
MSAYKDASGRRMNVRLSDYASSLVILFGIVCGGTVLQGEAVGALPVSIPIPEGIGAPAAPLNAIPPLSLFTIVVVLVLVPVDTAAAPGATAPPSDAANADAGAAGAAAGAAGGAAGGAGGGIPKNAEEGMGIWKNGDDDNPKTEKGGTAAEPVTGGIKG